MSNNLRTPAALIATAILAAILSSRTHGVLEADTAVEPSRYAQAVHQIEDAGSYSLPR